MPINSDTQLNSTSGLVLVLKIICFIEKMKRQMRTRKRSKCVISVMTLDKLSLILWIWWRETFISMKSAKIIWRLFFSLAQMAPSCHMEHRANYIWVIILSNMVFFLSILLTTLWRTNTRYTKTKQPFRFIAWQLMSLFLLLLVMLGT